MAYIREKTVKGEKYLYLVKSIWNSERQTSQQEIVKYLGKTSKVKKEDVPEEYRDSPKIIKFFSTMKYFIPKREKILIDKFQKNLFNALKKGDHGEVYALFESFTQIYGKTKFFENILKPVIGYTEKLGEQGRIDAGTELICNNMTYDLINTIIENDETKIIKQKILICTPYGEQHNIGSKILESELVSKGYDVFNLLPFTSSSSILSIINQKQPDFVFISVTLSDNIQSAQRLIKQIKENYQIPIIIGGQATKYKNIEWDVLTAENSSLKVIPKLIQSVTFR